MGVFARENGEWVEADLRARVGSDWTDQYDNGYVRVGSEWVQFQPGPQGALVAPVNLTVVPWDISATGSWVNPAQPVTPTQVQFRIPELTTVWTEFTYPHTTATFPVLSPSTNYQMQVRYIVRTDGEVTATGPIATKFFTTLAPTGPGVPAADPGGSGGDSITYFPSPPGGTPGPVGGTDCWWEYMIQEFDVDLYVFNDTSLTAEVDGDIGSLTFNFEDEGFACGTTLRWKYREVCNSVPGEWEYGTAWVVICDYEDPCDSTSQSLKFSSAPFTDAILALPRICYRDGEMAIEDFITPELTYAPLTAYGAPVFADDAWVLRATNGLSPYGEPLVAGRNPALVPLGSSVPSLTADFSYSQGIYLANPPSAGSGAPVKLAEIGKTVKVYAYPEGSGFRITATFPKQGGGTFDLESNTELAVAGWHTFSVTIDQDGNKILYIDAAEDVVDTDTTRADFSGVTGDVELYANDFARVREIGVWGRALSGLEAKSLAYLYPWPYLINQESNIIPTSAASTTVSFPSGTAVGDLAMILIAVRHDLAPTWGTTPAGWTAVTGSQGVRGFYRVLDGTEGVSVAFSWTGTTADATASKSIAIYRNVDQTTPVVVSLCVNNNTATARTTLITPACGPTTTTDHIGDQMPESMPNQTAAVLSINRDNETGQASTASIQAPWTAGEVLNTAWAGFHVVGRSLEGLYENQLCGHGKSFRYSQASGRAGSLGLVLQAPKPESFDITPQLVWANTNNISTAPILMSAIMTSAPLQAGDFIITNGLSFLNNLAAVSGNAWLTHYGSGVYGGFYTPGDTIQDGLGGYWFAAAYRNVNPSNPIAGVWGRSPYGLVKGSYPRMPICSLEQRIVTTRYDRHDPTEALDVGHEETADLINDFSIYGYNTAGGGDGETSHYFTRPLATGLLELGNIRYANPSVIGSDRVIIVNGVNVNTERGARPALVGITNTPSLSTTTPTQSLTLPSLQAGDLIVVGVSWASGLTYPYDETQMAGQGYVALHQRYTQTEMFWCKTADGTETSVTFTSASGGTSAMAAVYRGAEWAVPVENLVNTALVAATPANIHSGLTGAPMDDCRVFEHISNYRNGGATVSFSDITPLFNLTTGNQYRHQAFEYAADAGAPPSATATANAGTTVGGLLVAVLPPIQEVTP